MKFITILTFLALTTASAFAHNHDKKAKKHDKEHQHVEAGDHEHDEAHHKDHDHKAHHPEHVDGEKPGATPAVPAVPAAKKK